MASKNLASRHHKAQPPKQQPARVTPLRLATSPASWSKLDTVIEKAVDDLCGDYDNDAVRALMLILDFLSSEDFNDRQGIIRAARRYAFRYTEEHGAALEQYLDRVSPARQRRVS